MRKYQSSKTGTILGVIDGGGQGDGVPRGQLRLVSQNETVKIRMFRFKVSRDETHIKLGTVFEYKRTAK